MRCPPSRRPVHLGGVVRSQTLPSASDSATKAQTEDSSSSAKQRDVKSRVPKLATDVEKLLGKSEKPSDTEGDAVHSSPTASLKKDLSPADSTRRTRDVSHRPSFIARANPWSTYRKLAKVDKGELDAAPDEQGHLRFYDSSLVLALWKTTWKRLLLAVAFKAGQSILETTSSLVTKQLIAFITTSHAWDKLGEAERAAGTTQPPLSIGHGIGLAIGLAAMQEAASLLGNHYYLQSFGCGTFFPPLCQRLCF